MNTQPLDVIPLWMFLPVAAACVLLVLEIGYELGKWRHAKGLAEKDAPVGAIVGAMLGLLAFMLAFTFSLAASRFEARRQVILDEANAIGTTYLRARLLPDPQRSDAIRMLREYVDVRVRAIQEGKIAEAMARSEALHDELWACATASAEKDRHSIMTGLFVQSLNDVIDVHAKRVQVGVRSRIPVSIWIALFALALLGMCTVGYQAGLSATRRSPAMLLMTLAFAGVLLLIVDLDRPADGFLRVSQQAMLDLQRSMKSANP